PRGVDTFEWSPDGTRLAVLSSSRGADRKADTKARRRLDEAKPGTPPASDYRYFDRLGYQLNGAGFIDTRKAQVWIVEAATGAARKLTSYANGVDEISWSPDGKRLAITTAQRRDADLTFLRRVLVLDPDTGAETAIAARPDGIYFSPAWLPDGKRLAILGGTRPDVYFRTQVLLFAADGSEARGEGTDLTGAADVMAAPAMGSDLTPGEGARPIPIDGGRSILFNAAHAGALDLWRVATDGGGKPERLTDGHHYLSGYDAVAVGARTRVVAIRSTASQVSQVVVGDLTRSARSLELRTVANLNEAFEAEVELREPEMRWVESEGRRIQSWLVPGGEGRGRKPAVVEIHGGPHTFYGWSPYLEFQVLAGAGISVLYTNPRGSDGYGRDFNRANINDWGVGPMRDVLACVDAWIEAGRIDGDRLGVTGGSYGGYLTNWIVGHTDRFKAALSARSVSDLSVMYQTGDLTGTDWPSWEVGKYPWEDPARHRELSPVTYADAIHTPLLIQHSEKDIRTTVAQAEILFARLRRLRRPVRFMRVPEETHELTRSGTPFRRVENLIQVRDWFSHFLVAGKRGLPPMPRTKHGI
ncbi:MAG TPA: S9 family peptidase, partial [Candidatus Limnocylindrales bacterium]